MVYLVVELSRKLLQFLRLSDAQKTSVKRKAEDEHGSIAVAGTRAPGLRARQPSLVDVDGFGQSIAVLTSGGDAQGMQSINSVHRVPHLFRIMHCHNGENSLKFLSNQYLYTSCLSFDRLLFGGNKAVEKFISDVLVSDLICFVWILWK